jgi:hypothetical protein
MFRFGRPKIAIDEIASLMLQVIIHPEKEARDWDSIAHTGVKWAHFQYERFCFLSFVTIGAAQQSLKPAIFQAFVDVFFGITSSEIGISASKLQERVARYVKVSNAARIRMPKGTLYDVCGEFSRLCTGNKAADPTLMNFADSACLQFGAAQMSALESFRVDPTSFVGSNLGTFYRNTSQG